MCVCVCKNIIQSVIFIGFCKYFFIALLYNGAMEKFIEEGKHLINFHLMKMYFFSIGSIFS